MRSSQTRGTVTPPSDRERLAGDVPAGVARAGTAPCWRCPARVTVVFRLIALDHRSLHFFRRDAQALRLRRDDARSMRSPSTMPGWMQLTRTLVRPGLRRQALGEADHRPLRRRVRRAHAEAEAARPTEDRLMMLPPPAALIIGIALRGAIEHAVQVDGDAAVPVLGPDVLDLAGRAGDAGVVDQYVQAAEIFCTSWNSFSTWPMSATSASGIRGAGLRVDVAGVARGRRDRGTFARWRGRCRRRPR